MSLATTTVWEVRPTGNDQHGGGFNSARGGTDYSQQDAAQVDFNQPGNAFSSTAVDSATISIDSLTALFTAAMVGNIIYVNGGTNAVVGRYEIVTFVSSTSVTLDRSPSTPGTQMTGATGYLGGSVATLGQIASDVVGSNTVWVKEANYNLASEVLLAQSVTPSNTVKRTKLWGYGTTRGDKGRPTFTATASGARLRIFNGDGWDIRNFILDAANVEAYCIFSDAGANYNIISNVWCKRWTSVGLYMGGNFHQIFDNELGPSTATLASGALRLNNSYGYVTRNYIHDINQHAISGDAGHSFIDGNIIYNVSGANHGIYTPGPNPLPRITRNTIVKVGGSGIVVNNTTVSQLAVRDNLIAGCGGYGLSFTNSGWEQTPEVDHNAFYNNTSGNYQNIPAGEHDVQMLADGTDTNLAKLFTDITAGNFLLTNTAGYGASCRAAGFPSAWPGLASTPSNNDIGATQHADPVGGGGSAGGGKILASSIIHAEAA